MSQSNASKATRRTERGAILWHRAEESLPCRMCTRQVQAVIAGPVCSSRAASIHNCKRMLEAEGNHAHSPQASHGAGRGAAQALPQCGPRLRRPEVSRSVFQPQHPDIGLHVSKLPVMASRSALCARRARRPQTLNSPLRGACPTGEAALLWRQQQRSAAPRPGSSPPPGPAQAPACPSCRPPADCPPASTTCWRPQIHAAQQVTREERTRFLPGLVI